MASLLKNKVMKNTTNGNTSAYYSYFEEKNGVNPVNEQFKKELNDYMGFVKKKKNQLLKHSEHAPSKVSDVLFDIWNKYESKVSARLFYQKLMQMGEFLVENKEYSTANWQCYCRYLNSICDAEIDKMQSVDDLKLNFFPNRKDKKENSDMTFRALMGHLICKFYLIVNHDKKLQITSSILEVENIMKHFRMITQILFETKHFCWLIYNASIYIYTIGRFMMQYGQAKIILEYFIFISLSMESSVILLSSKYLKWRATLYAATCQCFYDCRFYNDGEIFARRALSKINELHELEMASISGQKGIEIAHFREATIKVGIVLFKKIVYESRQKTKNFYRLKNKLTLKDINNMTWPRTGVEKILNEMFDCSSAQFLAITEALSDSNRRIAIPGAFGSESEYENLEIIFELLFAAEYLVNGGGGKSVLPNDKLSDFLGLVIDNSNQLSIAIQGNDGVHIKSFLRIVKIAFNFEAWEIFRRFSQKIIDLIEKDKNLIETYKADLLIIYLLQTTEKYYAYLKIIKQIKNDQLKATLIAAKEKSKNDLKYEDININVENKIQEIQDKKLKVKIQNQENIKVDTAEKNKENESTNEQEEVPSSPKEIELRREEDILLNIAYKIILIIDSNISPDQTDHDVLIDITLLLWIKCKEIFQKYQNGSEDNFRWVTKLGNFSKWLYILNVTHESMCFFEISSIDPVVFGHCSLRLGLVYESLANINFKRFTKDSSSQLEVQTFDEHSATKTYLTRKNFEYSEISSERFGASNDIKRNLIKAKYVLKKALDTISIARATVSKADKSCICDKDHTLEFVDIGLKTNIKVSTDNRKIKNLKNLKEKSLIYKDNFETHSVTQLISHLHIELIFLYHKISVRLLQHRDNPLKEEKILSLIDEDFEILLKECRKNRIFQSLLFLSRALSLTHFHLIDQNKLKKEQKNLIQKAHDRLKEAEFEDETMFSKHVKQNNKTIIRAKIPPAPIVCLKTYDKIVVQPRNFESIDGKKAFWYRVFAGHASNINNKARISDYIYIGSGEQIPAKTSEKVSISGLSSNEQYLFAVAAYDQNGSLIGDSIGESTDPILAFSTLSILMSWAYLCQVSYKIGDFEMSLLAFDKLWNLFVIKPTEPLKDINLIQNKSDYEVSFHQLNYEIIQKTSPILLRKFLECIFISIDIKIKTKKMFCDVLFNRKFQNKNQIDRLRECENLLVAIEIAAWLNDSQIILQAIVQCYGLLTPLIYFNLAYEPIVKIMSHCLIILNELPTSILIKKPKYIFENLQHMIACSTFYLTDILKRFDQNVMSNFFNKMGRKLIGIEENVNNQLVEEPEVEDILEDKFQKSKKFDEKIIVRHNEIKALENQLAKSNLISKNILINMLTGNEDMAKIYSFIINNPTKIAYKELIKFRNRSNFFELLIGLLHKALNEDLSQDITEWYVETVDWLQKRNLSIIGDSILSKKKADLFVTKVFTSDTLSEINDTGTVLIEPIIKNKTKNKRKIKKYKLLIPIDLDLNEKIILEQKQKTAIDLLCEKLPDLYQKWSRRRKFRKLLQNESAFKSQFYVVNALCNFSQLIKRAFLSKDKSNQMEKINSVSYLDPNNFLFDKANVIIMNYNVLTKPESLNVKQKKSESKILKAHLNPSTVSNSVNNEIVDIKDTVDLIADILNGLESNISGQETTRSTTDSNTNNQIEYSIGEFVDKSSKLFEKFKIAVVIAHRGKQWTQLQNACKHMFNCINSLVFFLPAMTATNKKSFTIKDLWRSVSLSLYLAADNLIDMLFLTFPIEKHVHREIQNKINKWYDSNSIGKSGAPLQFDSSMDDINSIDLRFVKDFVLRSIQCLFSCEKWEKCMTISLKFNALTSYKYAELLSPIIAFSQHKILNQISTLGGEKSQKHFEKLKAELGRYPRIEDLFFINFKIEVEKKKKDKFELGAKIDPKVHDIYKDNIRCKEIISVPLDIDQTLGDLKDAIDNSFYHSRALLQARRLLSLFLLSKSCQTEFFTINQDSNFVGLKNKNEDHSSIRVEFQPYNKQNVNQDQLINTFFHSSPINFLRKDFKNENDVFVKNIDIHLDTVIESYKKCIQMLIAFKENDQTIQALHELGNLYHFSNQLEKANKNWNEALDKLTGIKNCLVNWRKFFSDKQNELSYEKVLEKCGIWGCLLGGVLTSKISQYIISNDMELKTECCLLSATFFKSIFRASIPYSPHDYDYTKYDIEFINSNYLLPGLMFNSEIFRFDVRYVISSLNFVCIDLLNAGHYLKIMPSLVLYEYIAKILCRDISHTILARLIKIEALTKLNMFKEAISIIFSLQKAESVAYFFDEKGKNFSSEFKYKHINWNPSKPIFDLNNLKCLETLLYIKLPLNVIKLYGSHLSTKFYLIQCKLLIQIASCIPCSPNFKEYNSSQLFKFHESYALNLANLQGTKLGSSLNTSRNNAEDLPEMIKIFCKTNEKLSLESVKGFILGSAKTIVNKCLKAFDEDFPKIEKYTISNYWQKEFKYELHLLLANIADQSNLNYFALQNVFDALKELAAENIPNIVKEKNSMISVIKKNKQLKELKIVKKGIYQFYDSISRSHLNSRLWLKARKLLVQYMFNQLNDIGKAKGHDNSILSDFGDLKYYCEKGIKESNDFIDLESKSFFIFIEITVELLRGQSLNSCLEKLNNVFKNLVSKAQLSQEGFFTFIKTSILIIDIKFPKYLLEWKNENSNKINLIFNIDCCMRSLLELQQIILTDLSKNSGELIECSIDKSISYNDNIFKDIKNLFNPLLHYLVHVKLRLGSYLILKSSYFDRNFNNCNLESNKLWENSLNVLGSAIEINKVISERSLNIEIELFYKYSFCMKELLLTRKIGTLYEVVNSYGHTINLIQNSVHDLYLIKQCYLEIAVLFIFSFDHSIISDSLAFKNDTFLNTLNSASKYRAIEAAITALAFSIDTTKALREKMLLSGNELLKNLPLNTMSSCPIFIANDLIANYLFADRKRLYRDKIEEEVLTLVPEFEIKKEHRTYDSKIEHLCKESERYLTWIHILNYQNKLHSLSTMRNLNTLRNGNKKFIFSDFFTTGFTPIFNNSNMIVSRLYEINYFLKNQLDICNKKNQTKEPITDFFRIYARKLNNQKNSKDLINFNSILKNVKVYKGNISNNLSYNFTDKVELKDIRENLPDTKQIFLQHCDWGHLQEWPPGYTYLTLGPLRIDENNSYDSFANYIMTMNWHKNIIFQNDNEKDVDKILCIVGIRDKLTSNKIKFKNFSAGKIKNIHQKLVTYSAIAKTSDLDENDLCLDSNTQNKIPFSDCLSEICELFDKKFEDNFKLNESNIMDLESMFNINFGGYTNDESIKNFILNLFL